MSQYAQGIYTWHDLGQIFFRRSMQAARVAVSPLRQRSVELSNNKAAKKQSGVATLGQLQYNIGTSKLAHAIYSFPQVIFVQDSSPFWFASIAILSQVYCAIVIGGGNQ